MKTKRETRKKTPEIICAVLLSATLAVCHAADINVVIPWQGGAAFTTNINVYGTTLGYTKTLRVTPETCYHFKNPPTQTHGRLTVTEGTVNHCEANYTMTLTSTNLQGWITVSGEIEPSNECGSCGTGGGGNPQDQNFDVTVTQRVAWAYFSLPANGTNLTACAGCTNTIETKVVLGDAGIPSAGTVNFSANPSTLGTFLSNNISLTANGTASTSFVGSTNGAAGTITASASGLKDEQGKDVPNVTTNLTVNNVEITGVTAQGATHITNVVGNAKILHFITPKGAANSSVTLTATVNPNNQRVKDAIDWEGATEEGNDPLKATVPKDVAGKNVVKIKVNGKECKELRVWSVWSVGSVNSTGTTSFARLADTTIDGTSTTSAVWAITLSGPWVFKFAVTPSTIITDTDRPDLSGSKSGGPPGGNSEFTGDPLSGGADKKWDVSRKVKDQILNANLIPKEKFSSGFGSIYDGQPQTNSIAVNFPSEDVVGNDDSSHADEDNNPYSAATGTLAHEVGEVTSRDSPSIWMPEAGAAEGYTYEELLFFREFLRLELGDTWYRISDFLDWHHKMKIKFDGGQWINDGSSSGTGH